MLSLYSFHSKIYLLRCILIFNLWVSESVNRIIWDYFWGHSINLSIRSCSSPWSFEAGTWLWEIPWSARSSTEQLEEKWAFRTWKSIFWFSSTLCFKHNGKKIMTDLGTIQIMRQNRQNNIILKHVKGHSIVSNFTLMSKKSNKFWSCTVSSPVFSPQYAVQTTKAWWIQPQQEQIPRGKYSSLPQKLWYLLVLISCCSQEPVAPETVTVLPEVRILMSRQTFPKWTTCWWVMEQFWK